MNAGMNWQVVPLASALRQPWKNGGGSTRELLAWPSAGAWRIRMSVAEVAKSGPFSVFEGVQRCFAVLEGDGVVLSLEGGVHVLTPDSEPFEFDGAAAVDCTLVGGATQDFNLMARGMKGTMIRVRGAHRQMATRGTLVAAYACAPGAVLRCAGDEMELPPDALAWRMPEADMPVAVEGSGVLWMEIKP